MDINDLAKKLSRNIFEIGDIVDSPCTRMQFKGGDWPAKETDQGGLCESGLELNIKRLLEGYRNEESN